MSRSPSSLIRVLVVEDSELFAEALVETLEEEPSLQVVGTARNGVEAIRLAEQLTPDVITMDVNMPVMGGLEAIEAIMASTPTPILVLSADERGPTGELSFEALRRGAVDLMLKPMSFPASREEGAELRSRVRLLSSIPVVRHIRGRRGRARRQQLPTPAAPVRAVPIAPQAASVVPAPVAELPVIIGLVASTGGPAALAKVLERLPSTLQASIVVVQHLAPGFAPTLAGWLDRASRLSVAIADEGARLTPGSVWVAPDGAHSVVTANGHIHLQQGAPVDGHLPSGTRLLQSVARVAGQRGVGIVMTGMGRDGARGLAELKRAGGATFVQDAKTSVVHGMPQACLELAAADEVVPLGEIAVRILEAIACVPGGP